MSLCKFYPKRYVAERRNSKIGERPGMSIKVKFASSDVEAVWTEGSVLEFAEKAGVTPDYGCRGGACGCCETRLIAGDVTYMEEPSFEPDDGHVLLCCSRPKEGIEVLELDL